MLYPLRFDPLPIERVWGGTALQRYGKPIPAGQRIGESWEISDRDDALSVVVSGPSQGRTLRQVVEASGTDLLGTNAVSRGTGVPPVQGSSPESDRPDACPTVRFPLLVKLLDARERLSLQVHPSPAAAARLGGEPKTEMWYVLEAQPGAGLFTGLRRGVTRQAFEDDLQVVQSPIANRQSAIEHLLHRLPVSPGDTIFIPAGRLHAIDAGLVLVEIQQNSDTTYRVFDWGRVGLDGNPRPLHVEPSLGCIDFDDFEPGKQIERAEDRGGNGLRRLVECEQFHVHRLDLSDAWPEFAGGTTFHILTGLSGAAGILTPDGKAESLRPGEFVLIPAALGHYTIVPVAENTRLLKTTVPPPGER